MARALSNPVRLVSPEKGVDGRTLLAKARAPLVTDARIGDFWIDTVSKKLYGPKHAGGWPDNGLIRGAPGWAPHLVAETDGTRRVFKIDDWTGGEGTKPGTGYLAPDGTVVADVAEAADFRGEAGPQALINALDAAGDDLTDNTQIATGKPDEDNKKRDAVEVFDLGGELPRKSIAHAEASNVRPGISKMLIDGLRFERVGAEPDVPVGLKVRTLDRWTPEGDHDSANGGWWGIAKRTGLQVDDFSSFAEYVAASSDGGFFTDDETPGISSRARDRLFVGDAARYTGNRFGANGYGSSWLTEIAPSYLVKNATFAAAPASSVHRIGILGASRTEPEATSSVNMGVGALSINEGVSTSSRAFYAEAIHKTSVGGATAGIEIQAANYTGRTPVANAYSLTNLEVHGVYIAAEGGVGYTSGDADTPLPISTAPSGAAIDIAGGVDNTPVQKWVVGIVMRNGSLVRDGNNFATAMSLAQKHVIKWEIGAAMTGASIWSEVTQATQRVAIKMENLSVKLLGDGGRILLDTLDDGAGAGAINYMRIGNGRAGIPPSFTALGSDTNIGFQMKTKGTGTMQFQSHGGAGENLRITPPSTAPTDYMTISGSAGGGLVALGAAGASADINIRLVPKGAGYVRFGTWTSSADVEVNGYITVRDDNTGTVRKLATIA